MAGPVLSRDTDGTPTDPTVRSCLRMLAQRGARLIVRGHGATVEAPRKNSVVAIAWIDAANMPALDAAGWLTGIGDGRFILSPTGRNIVRLMKAGLSPAEAANGTLSAPPPPLTEPPPADVDRESPLAWLRARRDKDGKLYLSDEEFQAGERLREDFHRAAMMPRVTVDWEAIPRTRDESRGMAAAARANSGGSVDAQVRVRRALAAVPPELSGLLIDVCCFGHRLQEAAQARDLPQRAGHYVLVIALKILARHYGLLPPAESPWPTRSRLRHWGTADFRPTIGG